MSPSISEDDFILTLSDNDQLSVSSAEIDSGDLALSTSLSDKKRKRTNEANLVHLEGGKRQKKIEQRLQSKHENGSDNGATFGSEEGEPDGAIDPDFEFDVGHNASTGITEDFDGWGESQRSKQSNERGGRKAVDIDEIIARRAAKKVAGGRTIDEQLNTETRQAERDYDDEDEEELASDFPDFEDEELLAADTFGAGADAESDSENEEGIDVASDGESGDSDTGSEGQEEENDDGSDDNSVASPTAHPDDVDSEGEDTDSQTTASDTEEIAKRTAFFAPEGKLASDVPLSGNAFTSFSLSRPILRSLTSLAFNKPTPIQTRTIPLALAGHDLVGSAVTGSGKTAAFLLPILERLLYRPRRIPTTRVSILVPTRELAVQCHAVAVQLAKYTDITFALVVGGFSLREQEAILKKRPDVVIATPGRYIDHMRNSASFTVENIEILVLDEADRMLEDGFADELDEILRTIPRSRQTMLFSATMTERIDKLVRVGMNRPVRVSVDKKKATTGGLVQEFVRLRPGREGMRLATLAVLCTNVFTERTIVFFRQKKEAHRVRIVLGLLGVKAGELHGSMSQEQRIAAVEGFRDGRTTHMLATDLASRGLDIKNVVSVINYEAPQSHEIYVHRVGRTARAGREGKACTIAAEPDRKVVKAAVKSAREQQAKVISRVMEVSDVDAMHRTIERLEEEVEEILKEEKEEKQLAQAETQLTRGENLVRHEAEIMSRPKRTWFESEKEKRIAKKAGRAELNGPASVSGKSEKQKAKLSGKDKKRLDDRRERMEGKTWRKGKGSEEAVKRDKANQKRNMNGKTKTRGPVHSPRTGKPAKFKRR